ncbi:hypothetical protein CCYS_04355 [Corynebacterium cystitidis DSM 20524]|uniref:Uncharacterized protein n=1 Tax=Corynebacterium cystitidis DSM 20524 TaxID=1121357 RepID=A0A1H9WCC5_9CORY|nr:hypothetical protein CCYS_04355 [Corynebacterium cystitidis DSM 20524]SES31560.1 hypothetical protein SAMN05661109_02658 [Corynebacterium cystitidis DSM 20524]SNV83233.1 Uncharacterised protein [Corynebacterium cystitidis]
MVDMYRRRKRKTKPTSAAETEIKPADLAPDFSSWFWLWLVCGGV